MKTLVSAAAISAVLSLTVAPAMAIESYTADANTGLLYHFDEPTGTHSQGPGTYFITDASGNGNHLRTNWDTSNPTSTTSNPAISPFDGVAGPTGLGTAATFQGGQRAYRLFGDADLSVLNRETFTIEAWVRNPGPGTFGGVIRIDDDIAGGGSSFRSGIIQFGLDNDLDQIRLAGFNTSNSFFEVKSSQTVSFEQDVWYHIAVSYNGDGTGNDSEVKFYFDELGQTSYGTQLGATFNGVADFRAFNPDDQGSIWIGEWATDYRFNGDIDELRWSNEALDRFNLSVPEPASASLVGLGVAAFLLRRRR